MKKALFVLIFFGFTLAQTFEEQLSYDTSTYVFNQDSSLIAAVNQGSINIFDTDNLELVVRLEPEIPLCGSALFFEDSLYALCGHMLYQWDLTSSELRLEKEVNYPYVEYEDFIWRGSDFIVDVSSIAANEDNCCAEIVVAIKDYYCCDATSRLHVWGLDDSDDTEPRHEIDLMVGSLPQNASFSNGTLIEAGASSSNAFEVRIVNVLGQTDIVKPIFVQSGQRYSSLEPVLGGSFVLVRVRQNNALGPNYNWLFDLQSRKEKAMLDESFYELSKNGKWLSRRNDNGYTIWDAKAFLYSSDQIEDIPIVAYYDFVNLAMRPIFSGDEKNLLVKTQDTVQLYKIGQSTPFFAMNIGTSTLTNLSPDGRYILLSNAEQTSFIDTQNQTVLEQVKVPSENFEGFWHGDAKQTDSELSWQTNLYMTAESHEEGAAVAYVNYEPSYPCSSRLLFQGSQNGVMNFKEKLITGQGICVDNGMVKLELKDEQILWLFFKPDGLFDSSALLNRP